MKFTKFALLVSSISFLSLSSCADIGDLFDMASGEIILNQNSLVFDLNEGETSFQLEPTISSSYDTSELKFAFKSKNDGVATVTEEGLIYAIGVGQTQIEVSTSSFLISSVYCTIRVIDSSVQNNNYDYTVMMYLCGSTLEYSSAAETVSDKEVGLLSEDIREVLSTKDIPTSVKVIIETGGAKKWVLPDKFLQGTSAISNLRLQRWEVVPCSEYRVTIGGRTKSYFNKLKLVETLETNHMASESSFESFLKWGLKDYSSKQVGVVISGHGGGITGCAYDDNFTYYYGATSIVNVLSTAEIAIASKNALQSNSRSKFTWIGYDCCVMGCADIASIDADYYEYMVASQELENGEGWYHDVWLSKIAKNPLIEPDELLPEIVTSFVDNQHAGCPYTYAGDEGNTYVESCYSTLAVYDLSKISLLVDEFRNYTNANGTDKEAYQKYSLAFKNCKIQFGEGIFGLVDFKEFLVKMSSYSNYSITSLLDILNEIVIKNKYCEDFEVELCGINLFLPLCTSEVEGDFLEPSKNDYLGEFATKFTAWQNMCQTYGDWFW